MTQDVAQTFAFNPTDGESVKPQRLEWAERIRHELDALGLQAVFCKTRDGSPIPMPETTGSADFGAYVEPDKAFVRPAFRVPPGAIALDVDHKEGKGDGWLTIQAVSAELGELPPTQRLTARGPDQTSGRYLFRIPEGFRVDEQYFKQYGGHVDVVRTGHRFSMAPGDVHPGTGEPVVCYGPDGSPEPLRPVSEWPELPFEWLMDLAGWNETHQPDDRDDLDGLMTRQQAEAVNESALNAIRFHDTASSGFRALLQRTSITVGGFVGSLYAEPEQAEDALYDAISEVWGAEPDPDDQKLVTSGVEIGAARAWTVVDTLPDTEEAAEAAPEEKAAPKRLTLSAPALPSKVAREIERELKQRGTPLLISDGEWYLYRGLRYESLKDSQIETMLYRLTERAVYVTKDGTKDWAPSSKSIGQLQHALRGLTDTYAETGQWIGKDRPETGRVLVPLLNGIYDVERDELMPHDPRWFFTHCLPFAYDPAAQCPTWHKVLDAQWGDLPTTQQALSEWFGYVLSGRTDLQKIGAMYGPRRSAKGLIARILQALLGPGGSVGFSLASMGTSFGMQGLIGIPLAIEGDARWKGIQNVSAVVSRLLKIAGEDTVEIQRKYKGEWSGKLPTRLMILSNDMPEIPDAGGTAASRLLVFHTSVSFYGREDPSLEPTILEQELAGVFNWAVAGLHRLAEQGRFTDPEGAAEEMEEMVNAGSPVAEFVAECCDREPGEQMALDDLYKIYAQWYRDKNDLAGQVQVYPVAQTFSSQIRSVVTQPRGRSRVRVGGRRVAVIHGIKLREGASFAVGSDFS